MATCLTALNVRELSGKCSRLAARISDETISAALREMAAEFKLIAENVESGRGR